MAKAKYSVDLVKAYANMTTRYGIGAQQAALYLGVPPNSRSALRERAKRAGFIK